MSFFSLARWIADLAIAQYSVTENDCNGLSSNTEEHGHYENTHIG